MEGLLKRKTIDKEIAFILKGNYFDGDIKMYDGELGEGGPWRSPEGFTQELIMKTDYSLVSCRMVEGHSGRGSNMPNLK